MDHGPVLIPDITLLIQLGIFFASYLVMNQLVFKPYLALLEQRHAKTEGLREKANKARERAAKLQADYEAFMKNERKKIASWVEEERKKINDEERAIVQAARDAVAEELNTLRSTLAADTEKARRDLQPLTQEYASQIASRLLGRKVSVNASHTSKGVSAKAAQVVPT